MADHERDDDDEESSGEETAGGGGSKKKLLIIIGAAVVVLLGAGAGIYFSGLLDSVLGAKTETADATSPAEPEAKAASKSGEPAAPTGPVAFFDIPEMIVTLNTSPRSKAAFMKMRLSLELAQSSEIPKVQLAMPRVVDNLQSYLRELRVEELRGSAGTYRLKEEMLMRIRAAVPAARINTVLIKEYQVQ